MQKPILMILILCAFLPTSAQEVVYYYGSDYGVVTSETDARYKKIVYQRNSNATKIKTFVKEDGLWKQELLNKLKKNRKGDIVIKSSGSKLLAEKSTRSFIVKPDGSIFFKDYVKGKLFRSGTTSQQLPLLLQDTIKIYYPDGSLKSIAWYENNCLLGNHNWLKNGSQYIDNIHYYVDDIPEHTNGQTFFIQYMVNGIKESGIDITQIDDVVAIGMVIKENGNADGLNAVSGLSRKLNETIINLIRDMPGNWVPATLHGKSVNYYMEIPFDFRYSEAAFQNIELTPESIILH